MRWPFSGLFRQRAVKEGVDFRAIASDLAAPSAKTLWAIRRTADMADLRLSMSGAKVKHGPDGGRILVADGALTLTAWFRPQHAEERVLVADKVFDGPMTGRLSGWSRVVVSRPKTAPAEMPFTAQAILGALQNWPLVLSRNAAPAAGERGDLQVIGVAHGLDASDLDKATSLLTTAGSKAAQKISSGGAAGPITAKQGAMLKDAADKAVVKAVGGLGVTSPELLDAAHATFNQGAAAAIFDFTTTLPPGKPGKPAVGVTALELPNRLYLSPTRMERFRHRTTPFEAAGRTELWHSRLVLKTSTETGGDEEASRDPAAVRPIWTPDLVDAAAGQVPPLAAPGAPVLAMSALDRSDLVHLGAHYDTTRNGPPGKWLPTPARVRRLELSALGGFLDLHGQWPAEGLPKGVALTAWKQRLSLGRDSRVEIVKAGVLAPFGHRAVLIEVTTREVKDIPYALIPGDDAVFADVAILVKRFYIAVTEPRRDFDAGVLPDQGRGMPLTRVEILNGVTQVNSTAAFGYWPVVFGQSTPMPFAVRAEDAAGRTVRFSMPMAFTTINKATSEAGCKAFVKAYAAAPAWLKQAPLSRQVVCLAEDASRDSLSLPVQTLGFEIETFDGTAENGGYHRFRPALASARIEAPGSREFAGGARDVEVRYFKDYVQGGFGGANTGEVALELTTPLPLFAPGSGASSEKAGPVATPRVAVLGYSRLMGAVTGKAEVVDGATSALAQVAGGTIDPKTLIPDMKLLGAFKLSDLIQVPTSLPSADGEVKFGEAMRLKREKIDPDRERTVLTFHQRLDEFGEGLVFSPWNDAGGAELEIKAVASIGSGDQPAAQSLEAVVRRFGISFFSVVRVDFNRLAFTIRPGSKPDLDLVFADRTTDNGRRPLTFTGDLAFVQQLADILPISAFSDPPDLQITSDGVVAGYSLGLPPLQLGALALSNIGFGARFQLPFLGDAPSLRLNFAERHSPFGVLVALLGGGGFFAVELDTHGLKSIEGTLEAQAGIAINLGVAAGAVTARLGIYYRWVVTPDEKMTFEAFAELRGELCVLGLITASITFHVALRVESSPAGKELVGLATVTVEIELLFFSKSVSVECERRFQGSKGDPTFAEVYPMTLLATPDEAQPGPSLPKAWTAYASAFA